MRDMIRQELDKRLPVPSLYPRQWGGNAWTKMLDDLTDGVMKVITAAVPPGGGAPDPEWWAVYDKGKPCAAYPNRKQAEVYASGFSREVEIRALCPAGAAAGPSEPMELWLCEAEHVFLRPDELYRFRVHPTCAECAKLAEPYAAAVPPDAAQPGERERALREVHGKWVELSAVDFALWLRNAAAIGTPDHE